MDDYTGRINQMESITQPERMNQVYNCLTKEEADRINVLMKRGIVTNEETGLKYFTGYAYTALYDWDQYFEGIVQLYMGWDTAYIKNAVTIFLKHQQENGFTKRAIQNGYSGEEDFKKLQKSLDYWLYDRDKNKNNLSTWRSSIETGMDDQHERGGIWKSDYCEGVDLNTYLYRECSAFAALCDAKGYQGLADKYRENVRVRKEAVLVMWDEEDGYFYDRDERTGEPIKVKSISGMLPALAADEPGYSPVHLDGDIGCNWRANTWVPTNYMIMHGLLQYGYKDIAKVIAAKTKELIKISGDREYYLTETGQGDGLDPFWGWSLLGYFMEEECRLNFNPAAV